MHYRNHRIIYPYWKFSLQGIEFRNHFRIKDTILQCNIINLKPIKYVQYLWKNLSVSIYTFTKVYYYFVSIKVLKKKSRCKFWIRFDNFRLKTCRCKKFHDLKNFRKVFASSLHLYFSSSKVHSRNYITVYCTKSTSVNKRR